MGVTSRPIVRSLFSGSATANRRQSFARANWLQLYLQHPRHMTIIFTGCSYSEKRKYLLCVASESRTCGKYQWLPSGR